MNERRGAVKLLLLLLLLLLLYYTYNMVQQLYVYISLWVHTGMFMYCPIYECFVHGCLCLSITASSDSCGSHVDPSIQIAMFKSALRGDPFHILAGFLFTTHRHPRCMLKSKSFIMSMKKSPKNQSCGFPPQKKRGKPTNTHDSCSTGFGFNKCSP